jgi:hypothetical protein
MQAIRFRATLLRNDPRLGLYFRIPARLVQGWGLTATTTVEGTIGGHPIGRRAIKDSGPKTADWYMALTRALSEAIGGREGDEVEVELWQAEMAMPAEMASHMKSDAQFATAYKALKPDHGRAAIEHYLEAKTAAGRTRRLDKIDRSIKARLTTGSSAKS